MKKQTTAVLLCALLFSTFAHEHQQPQSQNRMVNNHHNSKHLSHLAQNKRDGFENPFGVCGWKCPGQKPNKNIEIVINATTNIMGLVNLTANIEVIYDFNNQLIQTGNGTTGNLIMVDPKNHIGTHVINKTSALFWLAANSTFEAYINSLPSLKPLMEESLKLGYKFDLATTPEFELSLFANTFIKLGTVLGRDIKKDYSNALVVYLDTASRLNSVLNGPLAGLFTDITRNIFSINVDLEIIVERFEGLAYDLSEIQGGLGTLIKHHIKIDLQKILGAKSGLESFTYLLTIKVDGGLNLVPATGAYPSFESIFDVIVHLSGASSEGYSAYVRVVSLVIGAANGNVTTDVLIDALVKYSIIAKDDKNLYDQFNASLQDLLKIVVRSNTNGKLDSSVNDLKKLINGTLVIGGVNIAKVAKILAQNGNNVAIDLVIGVLVNLGSTVNVSESIPDLLLYILTELNSSSGVTIIINLFPNINISGSIGNSSDGNNLQSILKNVNIGDLISSGLDIIDIVEKLPIIGDICLSISASLDTQSKGSIKFNVVIKSSGASSIVKIHSLLGSVLHIDLSILPKSHHHVQGKHTHKHENRHIKHLKHGIQEKIHHHQK